MDNIVDSRLYRPGSVAYVSKSGGAPFPPPLPMHTKCIHTEAPTPTRLHLYACKRTRKH
jgi:hypothetical protein